MAANLMQDTTVEPMELEHGGGSLPSTQFHKILDDSPSTLFHRKLLEFLETFEVLKS
jgi:hypothetical protein